MIEFLRGEEAFALRREFGAPPGQPEPDPLRLATQLRRRLEAERARALAEQIVLERRAHAKFEDPSRLLFDRVALEQATSPGIARWRAASLPEGARVVDLGCGLGADAMALARAGHRVVAIDRDATRAALAMHNLGAAGGTAQVVCGDAAALPAWGDVLYADPDRRTGRGRVFRLTETSPDLAMLRAVAGRFASLCVKAPPALSDSEVPPDADAYFLSEGSECREAFLRMGEGASGGRRFAVLVESGEVRPVGEADPAPVAADGTYLLDPDPALRRAGGVDDLADELGAGRAAAGVTYLFAEEPAADGWARSYRVRSVFPFRPRDWERKAAEDPPRELVVKQRGVGIDEASVRAKTPWCAAGPRLALVIWADGPRRIACLCEPIDPR